MHTRPRLRIVGSARVAPAMPPIGDIDRSGCPASSHGTYLDVVHRGCRCQDAAWDRRRWRAVTERRHLAVWVDSIGATRRLRGVAWHRHSLDAVSEVTGVSPRWLAALRSGQNAPRVERVTIECIIAACDHFAAAPGGSERAYRVAMRNGWHALDAWPGGWIDDRDCPPYLGHRRRLAGLAVEGWPLEQVAAHCPGVTADELRAVWRGDPVRPGVGTAVVAVSRLLAGEGPSRSCRRWARRVGLIPGAAWEDIDDPTDHPHLPADVDEPWWVDTAVVDRLRDGQAQHLDWSRQQRRRLVGDLTERGRTAEAISGLLGVPLRTVERDRHHLAAERRP